MPLIERLFSVGAIRKAIWRIWYPYLTRKLRGEEVLFLNYAFETEPPLGLPLSPADESNRHCIQLYHHVGTQVPLREKNILEVSCGHGGGASYLVRTQHPARYTGLDLNPAGIRFCRERHRLSGLDFVQGDAGKLPFPRDTFDVVLNIEASHCYPDFPRFLAGVARVLRPGGHLLYADFRFDDGVISGDFSSWTRALETAPLKMVQSRMINAEVRRGMDLNSRHSQELIVRHLPRFLHSLGRDFAGIQGSRVYNALVHGELSYRSYCFVKEADQTATPDSGIPGSQQLGLNPGGG